MSATTSTLKTAAAFALVLGLCTAGILSEPSKAQLAAQAQKAAAHEAQVKRDCAAARVRYDALYKQGEAHPEASVNLRQICEPDVVAKEQQQTWAGIALCVILGIVFLPILAGASIRSGIPSTMR